MPRSLTSSSVFQSKEGATPCPSGKTRSSPTRTRPTSTRCRTRRWPRWSSSIPHFPLRHSLDHITLCADNCFIYLTNVKYKSFCAKLPLLSFGVVPLNGIPLGPVSCSPDPRMTVDLTAWTRPGRSSRMVRAPWRRSGTGGSRSSPPPPSSTRTSPSPADSPATGWWCSHLSPADIPTRPTLTEARKRRAKARINKISSS